MSKQRDLRVAAVAAAAVLVAAGLALAATIALGLYNVGADEPHTRLVASLLERLRDRSVEVRSQGLTVPKLDDTAMIAEGAEHYAAMCSGCHLAPGVTESEIRPGLYPQPPNLATDGIDGPKEAFWVIKHGIKMSGMPAWGRTHDDAAIWNIVAFLQTMPAMTPEAYRTLAGASADNVQESQSRSTPAIP